MDIGRVLVGVDFSDHATLALKTALRIASAHGAEVVAVHLCRVSEWPGWIEDSPPDTAVQVERRAEVLVEDATRAMRALVERLGAAASSVRVRVERGQPARGLIERIGIDQPDLVVLGNRGRGGMQRLLLGSVAERVARDVAVPTLVVRDRGAPATGFRRVVITTDFAPPAVRALEVGRAFADADTPIDLLNCWRIPGSARWDAGETPDDADPLSKTIHAQVEEAGAAWMAERVTGAGSLRFQLLNQRPVRGIQHWIRVHDCDLVVVGSHGHKPRERPELGRVATATLSRSPCSVLVVR